MNACLSLNLKQMGACSSSTAKSSKDTLFKARLSNYFAASGKVIRWWTGSRFRTRQWGTFNVFKSQSTSGHTCHQSLSSCLKRFTCLKVTLRTKWYKKFNKLEGSVKCHPAPTYIQIIYARFTELPNLKFHLTPECVQRTSSTWLRCQSYNPQVNMPFCTCSARDKKGHRIQVINLG